jgi:hypothetical protein
MLVAFVVLAGLVAPGSVHAAPPAYRATLTPREALFGDPLDARVDVVVDPAGSDPAGVRVRVDVRPYVASPPRVTRSSAGDLVRLTFAYHLRCLAKACLPGGPERTLEFPPVRISWGNRTDALRWPKLQLGSRVDPKDLAHPVPRSEVVRQPPVTWGVRPSLAIGALVGGAVLLLVFPAVLAFGFGRRLWRVWRTSRLERMTPLERALELLKRAAAGEEPESSRRALERVARELGDDDLGADARRLAWSRTGPDPQAMETLRGRVEDGG